MSSSSIEPRFSDADILALDTLLASEVFHDEAMSVVELQGLLCAIVSGPEPIAPSRWVPFVLGDNPDYPSEEYKQEISALLMRFQAEQLRALSEGIAPALVLADHDPEALADSYVAWAGAYLDGMELCEDEWFAHTASDEDEDELSDLLLPIDILSGLAEEQAHEDGEPWPPEGLPEGQLIQEARNDLRDTILALYQFWHRQRDN